MTITDSVYDRYLGALLSGDSTACTRQVQQVLDADVAIATLYTDLFQRSLYRVGELWETNRISVAVEHLATAITERLLAGVYPRVLSMRQPARHKAVVSCGVNEYHQVGARMVADVMELNGWDAWFLGASTPVKDLLSLIDEKKPDLVGLSLSMYFNLGPLKDLIQTLKAHYRQLDILIGGQAFRWGGSDIAGQFANVTYVPSLETLGRQLEALS
jgi:methanogenic corrinoid protein MtbC1